MITEYRPTVLGDTEGKIIHGDPVKAIEKLERDLKEQAESLRKTRQDYVNGMLTEDEFAQVEACFEEMLVQQRQILQNLRRAANK